MKDFVAILKLVWAALGEAAQHPIGIAFGAATARSALSDWVGGLRAWAAYFVTALVVSFAATTYLADESYTENRTTFLIILLAVVARDVLMVVLAIAAMVRQDPFGAWARLRAALAGQMPPDGEEKRK